MVFDPFRRRFGTGKPKRRSPLEPTLTAMAVRGRSSLHTQYHGICVGDGGGWAKSQSRIRAIRFQISAYAKREREKKRSVYIPFIDSTSYVKRNQPGTLTHRIISSTRGVDIQSCRLNGTTAGLSLPAPKRTQPAGTWIALIHAENLHLV